LSKHLQTEINDDVYQKLREVIKKWKPPKNRRC
jgi:hypothetical protein